MGLINMLRRRRARRSPTLELVMLPVRTWYPCDRRYLETRTPFTVLPEPERCPYDTDGSGSCPWHDQSCHQPEANGEPVVELTNVRFERGEPTKQPFEHLAASELESEATSSDQFIVSVDAARDGGEATILVFRHTADGMMEQVPATIVRERTDAYGGLFPIIMKGRSLGMSTVGRGVTITDHVFVPDSYEGNIGQVDCGKCGEPYEAHLSSAWDRDVEAASVEYERTHDYPTTPEEAYLEDLRNLPNGGEYGVPVSDGELDEHVATPTYHPNGATTLDLVSEHHFDEGDMVQFPPDPVDDGAVPPQDEVDAVMRAGLCDSSAIVGHPVLYQSDERGGKRYVLPARVTVSRASHPDLALTHAAANAGKVREPGDEDAITIEGKEATVNAGYAIKSKDGYYIADNPVPIPLDGTVHLKVDTPGPKGTYDEWSVPYDPNGAPRTWRFLADTNPF